MLSTSSSSTSSSSSSESPRESKKKNRRRSKKQYRRNRRRIDKLANIIEEMQGVVTVAKVTLGEKPQGCLQYLFKYKRIRRDLWWVPHASTALQLVPKVPKR